MRKPKALIITGLGQGANADMIQADLESKGYDVEVVSWDGNIDYGANYEYVVSHSAGTIQAQIYASRHRDSRVYVMGSPFTIPQRNVVSVTQWYDPITWINPFRGFSRKTGGRLHKEEDYYDSIKNEIPDVKPVVYASRTYRWQDARGD